MDTTNLVLGKTTQYEDEYNPKVLQRIKRELGRAQIQNLKPFNGFDVWHLYEITYLNLNGMPCVAMGIMVVPCNSAYIVESKSLKLYTFSYTQTKFKDLNQVQQIFQSDLEELLECDVKVYLYPLDNKSFNISKIKGDCLEQNKACTNLEFKNYKYSTESLQTISKKVVNKTVYTNLFRSLCPVTSQPDHACVAINYKGYEFNYSDLLTYLISLRNHQGFHEQCVELIYSDLMTYLNPIELSVTAYFTRRGGIDINPTRSNLENVGIKEYLRTIRQ